MFWNGLQVPHKYPHFLKLNRNCIDFAHLKRCERMKGWKDKVKGGRFRDAKTQTGQKTEKSSFEVTILATW